MSTRKIASTGFACIALCGALIGCGGNTDDDDDANAAAGTGGEVSTDTGGTGDGTGGSGATGTTSTGGRASTGGSGPTTTGGSGPTTGGSGPATTGGSGPIGTGGAVPDSPSEGLPQNAALSSLTPAQATQLCEQSGAYLADKLMPASCMVTGAMAGVFSESADAAEAVCQSTYNECMASPAEGSDCSTASEALASCSATVAELNQCYVDGAAQTEQLMVGVTCADAVSTTDPGTSQPTEDPASCQTVETKCPGMVSGSSGTG